MKNINCLIVFILISISVQKTIAQDLVLLRNGDSINCKVIEETKQSLSYLIKDNLTYTKKSINIYLVDKIYKNYYRNATIDHSNQVVSRELNAIAEKNIRKRDFNVLMGLNFTSFYDMFKDSPNDSINSYNTKLSNSYSIEVEMRQWLSKRIALGLNGSFYNSYAKFDKILLYDPSRNRYNYYSMSDKFNIFNVSPTLYYRTELLRDDLSINMFLAPELNLYRNYYSIDNNTAEITGKSYGFNAGLAFEHRFKLGMLAGIKFKYGTSSIKEIQFTYDEVTNTHELSGLNRINLTRINIGLYFGLY